MNTRLNKIEIWVWFKPSLWSKPRYYLKDGSKWFRIANNKALHLRHLKKPNINIIQSTLKEKQFKAMEKMKMFTKVLEFYTDK